MNNVRTTEDLIEYGIDNAADLMIVLRRLTNRIEEDQILEALRQHEGQLRRIIDFMEFLSQQDLNPDQDDEKG